VTNTFEKGLFMDRVLVLLRHGQSEWNLKNLFTGWRNPGLTQLGIDEARAAGLALRNSGIVFHKAFVSELTRAQDTYDIAMAAMGQSALKPIVDLALNERSYGELSGLNKDEARKKWGDHQVNVWRRSYETAPPGGESLRDTVARTVPYYVQAILPCVLRGEATIVAAHGNSLRALVMVLDQLTPKTIPTMEIATGVPLVYRLGPDGLVISKEVMVTELTKV
jgi:2,3-bisphosphoglycerate-dependent phosphoglycerate mutase